MLYKKKKKEEKSTASRSESVAEKLIEKKN